MELEKELAHLTNSQKDKVAENVEYIRVWRQMKHLNDKLMTTQEKNVALTTEINDLKTTLQQTTKYIHYRLVILTDIINCLIFNITCLIFKIWMLQKELFNSMFLT